MPPSPSRRTDAVAADVLGAGGLGTAARRRVSGARTRGLFRSRRTSAFEPASQASKAFHLGAEVGVAATGGVQERRTPLRGQVGRLVEQASCTRSNDVAQSSGRPRADRAPSPWPSRRASQARAKRQSRARVLDRDAEDGGRLLDAQPGEVAEHGDLGQVRLLRLELLDRLVQGEEVVGGGSIDGQALGQLDAPGAAAVLERRLAPRLLDEDVAHRPRGGAEEVAPAFPAGVLSPTRRRYASWTRAVG